MFQEKVQAWLSRKVPDRFVNVCFDLPAVLATDIGLNRSENQDRVAAMKISARASAGRPLAAIAVADGMGGMRDGAECAAIALAGFFYALTLYRSQGLEQRANAAILYANDCVFRFAGGKGGATLSAILVDNSIRPIWVNIGDSRIYAFSSGGSVDRLTVDDSLAEAVGGHGRELLQFMGMGPGIQPHIAAVPNSANNLAITTDGIHFLPPTTLNEILVHAPELKSAAERLAALARWCGGSDNASSAIANVAELSSALGSNDAEGIQLWDPFGSLQTLWIREDAARVENTFAEPAQEPLTPKPPVNALASDLPENKNNAAKLKKKRVRKKKVFDDETQFEIEIDSSPSLETKNDNS
ncbi:PP2C family protein-serine/threonine phosphatase [Mesorhizobium sp. f-mel]